MQELEKVLEEIAQLRRKASENGNFNVAAAYESSMEIICKHLSRENDTEITRSSRDKWIPVEKGMPEDEQMMLVTCKTKSGRRSVNRAWYGEGFWHGTGSMSGVIAWRPLPEPYQPEVTKP